MTDSNSVMVRASASGAGGRGFDLGPGHTKDFKNGTSGLPCLALSIIKQALASLLSKQNIASLTSHVLYEKVRKKGPKIINVCIH